MADEPRDPEDVPEDSGDGEAPEPPPPSTWAGRSLAGAGNDGADDEPGSDDSAGDEPDDVDDLLAGADQPVPGLTDDFEAVERKMSDDFDDLDTTDKAQSAKADHPVPEDEAEEADGDEDTPDASEDLAADPADEPELADVSPEVAAAAAAGQTIEADTLSLADREAAKEAAMEGVRARTKQHEVEEPSQRTAKAPLVSVPAPPASVVKEPSVAAAQDEPGGVGGAGEPPKRRGIGWRFVAAASLIIASIATATAVYSLLFLSDFAEGIGHNQEFASIKSQLAGVDGGPQTIMFLGSDSRAKNPSEIKKGEDPGRSDTTLLARIDPDADTINLLSLPRDLKVNIPGYGVDKLNAAYSYGGQDLTLKTVKNLLSTPGHPFEVNHVVNINFDGFYDAVNAIDCVYIDVDHHYYHSNEGLDPSEYYDEIDIPAGYQRLCGYNALNYVRYRHDDNDLIRGARQQDFVRELRQRIPPEKVFDKSLRDIFIKYTTSDISDANSLLEVLKTLFSARGAPVHQIQFEASTLGDATSTYVTATSKQIEDVRNQFFGAATPPAEPAAEPAKDSGGSEKSKNKKDKSKSDNGKVDPADAGTVDVSANTEATAQTVLKKKNAIDFPVYYPTQAIPTATLSDDSRAYDYNGPEEKEKYGGYKMVFSFTAPSYNAYYGVEGTNWADPPILDDPTDTVTVDGREYLRFYDGGKLRLVGFKTSDAAYWVDNSLTKDLTEPQMMAIAESMQELKN
ncbi:hypothetical protein BH10ACT11_BH10ACT11_04850 [soil metagenome]